MNEPHALTLPNSYSDRLSELKSRVRAAGMKGLWTVTAQLIELSWPIGRTVLTRHIQSSRA